MSGDFSTVCGSNCIKVTGESLVKSTKLIILYPLNFKSELVCVGQITLLWNQVKFIELFFFLARLINFSELQLVVRKGRNV